MNSFAYKKAMPSVVPTMRFGFFLGLLISAGVCAAAEEIRPGTDLRTEHYLLYIEELDPPETGRLLEAAYSELKKFFRDVEPDRKMQLKVFATQERYQSEI